MEAESGLLSGWTGLGVISAVGGLISGVAEALGECTRPYLSGFRLTLWLDLGSLDDNLTLPIISGGCIWGFMKLLTALSL